MSRSYTCLVDHKLDANLNSSKTTPDKHGKIARSHQEVINEGSSNEYMKSCTRPTTHRSGQSAIPGHAEKTACATSTPLVANDPQDDAHEHLTNTDTERKTPSHPDEGRPKPLHLHHNLHVDVIKYQQKLQFFKKMSDTYRQKCLAKVRDKPSRLPLPVKKIGTKERHNRPRDSSSDISSLTTSHDVEVRSATAVQHKQSQTQSVPKYTLYYLSAMAHSVNYDPDVKEGNWLNNAQYHLEKRKSAVYIGGSTTQKPIKSDSPQRTLLPSLDRAEDDIRVRSSSPQARLARHLSPVLPPVPASVRCAAGLRASRIPLRVSSACSVRRRQVDHTWCPKSPGNCCSTFGEEEPPKPVLGSNWSIIDVNDNTRLLMEESTATVLEHSYPGHPRPNLIIVEDTVVSSGAIDGQAYFRLPSMPSTKQTDQQSNARDLLPQHCASNPRSPERGVASSGPSSQHNRRSRSLQSSATTPAPVTGDRSTCLSDNQLNGRQSPRGSATGSSPKSSSNAAPSEGRVRSLRSPESRAKSPGWFEGRVATGPPASESRVMSRRSPERRVLRPCRFEFQPNLITYPYPRQYFELGFLGPDRDRIKKRQDKVKRQREYIDKMSSKNRMAIKQRTYAPFRHCSAVSTHTPSGSTAHTPSGSTAHTPSGSTAHTGSGSPTHTPSGSPTHTGSGSPTHTPSGSPTHTGSSSPTPNHPANGPPNQKLVRKLSIRLTSPSERVDTEPTASPPTVTRTNPQHTRDRPRIPSQESQSSPTVGVSCCVDPPSAEPTAADTRQPEEDVEGGDVRPDSSSPSEVAAAAVSPRECAGTADDAAGGGGRRARAASTGHAAARSGRDLSEAAETAAARGDHDLSAAAETAAAGSGSDLSEAAETAAAGSSSDLSEAAETADAGSGSDFSEAAETADAGSGSDLSEAAETADAGSDRRCDVATSSPPPRRRQYTLPSTDGGSAGQWASSAAASTSTRPPCAVAGAGHEADADPSTGRSAQLAESGGGGGVVHWWLDGHGGDAGAALPPRDDDDVFYDLNEEHAVHVTSMCLHEEAGSAACPCLAACPPRQRQLVSRATQSPQRAAFVHKHLLVIALGEEGDADGRKAPDHSPRGDGAPWLVRDGANGTPACQRWASILSSWLDDVMGDEEVHLGDRRNETDYIFRMVQRDRQ